MVTKLTRWDPLEDLINLWPRGLFSRELRTEVQPDGQLAVEWSPRCDVTRGDDAITVEVELPGVPAKDIEVSLEGPSLVIKGEKREERKEQKNGNTYSERFFGSFERRIAVPDGVDAASIEAKTSDGVLTIKVPVPPEPKVEARKIEITTG